MALRDCAANESFSHLVVPATHDLYRMLKQANEASLSIFLIEKVRLNARG